MLSNSYKYGYGVNLKSYDSLSNVYTAAKDGIVTANFNIKSSSAGIDIIVDGNHMPRAVNYSSALGSIIASVFVRKGQKIYYTKTSELTMDTNAWVMFFPYISY